jgi:hypothetical protein
MKEITVPPSLPHQFFGEHCLAKPALLRSQERLRHLPASEANPVSQF